MKTYVRGLSQKFAETANNTRIVYHRLIQFCIINTNYLAISIFNTSGCFLIVDLCLVHKAEHGARSAPHPYFNVDLMPNAYNKSTIKINCYAINI